MGIVTGYTADHMDEIQAACVIGGTVDGDNLTLMTFGGTPIDAGSVRGPQGDKGDKGDTGIQGPGNATDAEVGIFIADNGSDSADAVDARIAASTIATEMAALLANPTAYTPTLSATGTAPTGWGTSGFYVQIGKMVWFEATFIANSGFTIGSGAYKFGLPVAAANSTICPVGLAIVTSTAYNYLAVISSDSGASACNLYRPGTQTRDGSAGPYTIAWAVNNTIRIVGQYRAA